MDAEGLSGPGILWTASRIRRPDQLTWPGFLNWYDNDLVPRAIGTSGIRSAFRAVSTNGDQERPMLVCVVLDDLAFCGSDEFKAIPDTYKNLPGTGSIFEFTPYEFGTWNRVKGFIPIQVLGSNISNGNIQQCVEGYDNFGWTVGTSSTLFNGLFTSLIQSDGSSLISACARAAREDER